MGFSTFAISDLFADPFFRGDLSGFFPLEQRERSRSDGTRTTHVAVPINVVQTEEGLEVSCEVPGVTQEDLSVVVRGTRLDISGSRSLKATGKVVRSERWSGAFKRSLELPFSVEEDKVEATYSQGVLTVKLQKAAAAKEKRIEIKRAE